MSSLYEQIKADLGYLKLDAAASSFATLAEQAKLEDWSHIEFLARLTAEQATGEMFGDLERAKEVLAGLTELLDDLDDVPAAADDPTRADTAKKKGGKA